MTHPTQHPRNSDPIDLTLIARGDIIQIRSSGELGMEKRGGGHLSSMLAVVLQVDQDAKRPVLFIVAPLSRIQSYQGLASQLKVTPLQCGDPNPLSPDRCIELQHIRSIDGQQRIIRRIAALPPETVNRISQKLHATLCIPYGEPLCTETKTQD